MGLDSKLLAIGNFCESISDCMDYTEEHFTNIKKGYPIATIVFSCWTTSISRNLAEMLEIEVWDFSTHFIPNDKAKKLILDDFPEKESVRDFYKLVGAGFHFYFLPEG